MVNPDPSQIQTVADDCFLVSDYLMFTLAKLKILNHDPEYRTFVSRSIILVLIRR